MKSECALRLLGRAIFGKTHYCTKYTLVFKECIFPPLQDSHFWTRVSRFKAGRESLSCLYELQKLTLQPKLK